MRQAISDKVLGFGSSQQREQTGVRLRVVLIRGARGHERHALVVVGVERSAGGEARQVIRVRQQMPEDAHGISKRQPLQLGTERSSFQASLDLRRWPVRHAGPANERDHRHLHIEAQQPSFAVREHVLKRAEDDTKRRLIELMQRQPLAEQPVGREPLAHGGKMLACVEGACAITVRVEQISDDDVVGLLRGAHEAARVGGVEFEIRILGGGKILRLEELHCVHDFRHQFHRVGLELRIQRCRAERDARAHPEEQRALRIRMQQQRQMRLPILHVRRRRAAHLKTVVHTQRPLAVRVREHGDGRHHAFAVSDDAAARRHADDAQVGEQRPRARESAGNRDLELRADRGEQRVAQAHEQQCPFSSDEGNEHHSAQRGSERRTERVQGNNASNVAARDAGELHEMAEGSAHTEGGQNKRGRGDQQLGRKHGER